MTAEEDAVTQAITEAAIETAKAPLQEVMVSRAEATTRHRNEAARVRPKTDRSS